MRHYRLPEYNGGTGIGQTFVNQKGEIGKERGDGPSQSKTWQGKFLARLEASKSNPLCPMLCLPGPLHGGGPCFFLWGSGVTETEGWPWRSLNCLLSPSSVWLQPWAAPNKISPSTLMLVDSYWPSSLGWNWPLSSLLLPFAIGYTSDILLHIFSNISVSSLSTGFLLLISLIPHSLHLSEPMDGAQ